LAVGGLARSGVNGPQMFASAGEEERVPVRAQRGRAGRGTETETEGAGRTAGGGGGGAGRAGGRGGEAAGGGRPGRSGAGAGKGRRKDPGDVRCADGCRLTSAFCYIACTKFIWDRAGRVARFPKHGDLSAASAYALAADSQTNPGKCRSLNRSLSRRLIDAALTGQVRSANDVSERLARRRRAGEGVMGGDGARGKGVEGERGDPPRIIIKRRGTHNFRCFSLLASCRIRIV